MRILSSLLAILVFSSVALHFPAAVETYPTLGDEPNLNPLFFTSHQQHHHQSSIIKEKATQFQASHGQFKVSGLLTLTPVEGVTFLEPFPSRCNATLRRTVKEVCPAAVQMQVLAHEPKPRSKRQQTGEPLASMTPQSEPNTPSLALEHILLYQAVQLDPKHIGPEIRRLIGDCCTSESSLTAGTTGCNVKKIQAQIKHACMPSVQESGDILNG